MAAQKTIAVAGATGFVGRRLCTLLRDQGHRVIGIGRSVADGVTQDGVLWRRADLFSLLRCEQALEGVDIVYYLVHSMLPSARLTQARFEDMDLILADNIARAAALQGVQRIIYLGGLVPTDDNISRHLASRREVEDALAAHGVAVTTLRAGLVIGPHGSSFQILERLVRRLPGMILPRWTKEKTQPIALDDVLTLLVRAANRMDAPTEALDVGGPEVVTYRQLLEQTAAAMGVKRLMIGIPIGSPVLSSLWVTAVTGQPRQLTAPLIESLNHSMVAADRTFQQQEGIDGLSIADALNRALRGETAAAAVSVPRGPAPRAYQWVRSVQRMRLPPNRDADWAAHAYLQWLPRFLWPLLNVHGTADSVAAIRIRGLGWTLLELSYSEERSTADRALLYVTGGMLAAVQDPVRGRLELRTVLDGRTLIAAIHDFEPKLPWFLYTATQAQAHLYIMMSFRGHLSRRA